MKRQSEHQPIYQANESGQLVQSGSTSAFSLEDSSPYVSIKARAVALRDLLQSHGLQPQRSVTLTKFIDDAIELSDAWICGENDRASFNHLLSAAQIERIASAALSIGNCDNPKAVLEELLNGSIDLLDRQRSKAKDTLWELELLRILTEHKIDARIGEPDLIINFRGARVGMACKKIYSERNFSKVLSNAVAQIERDCDFGIVALNIDDLLPENCLLKAPTVDSMSAILTEWNYAFLRGHKRYLRRYLATGRALSALVSCAAIVDITTAKHRFMNARQVTVWHMPGMPEAQAQQMQKFFAAMNSQYEE
jgi:hypothetical protein